MARKNPMGSIAASDPGPVEGVDNLPLPIGVNRSGVKKADEASLDVVERSPMSPNNGGNRAPAADGHLDSGPDVRSYGSSPSADPAPGKTGA